jgi:hypothetical protein
VGGTETLKGKITQLSLCPHGLTEGLVVNGAFVKLPPHHDAEAALATLKVGDEVTVVGEVIATRPNHVLHHVSVSRKGAVVFDHEAIEERDRPPREPRRTALALAGKVVAVGTRKHGEIDRLLLSGNVSVHLEKHAELGFAVAVGDEIRVEGKGTAFPRGTFVRAAVAVAA